MRREMKCILVCVETSVRDVCGFYILGFLAKLGALGRVNGGTRTRERPGGSEAPLAREIQANKMVDRMVDLCLLLAAHGGHFSIENPTDSYMRLYPRMVKLTESVAIII